MILDATRTVATKPAMPTWYRLTIESDDPDDAESRTTASEHALATILRAAASSARIEALHDWLPQRRGHVFWLSQTAFEAAAELALLHGAKSTLGRVDMRFLVPLSF